MSRLLKSARIAAMAAGVATAGVFAVASPATAVNSPRVSLGLHGSAPASAHRLSATDGNRQLSMALSLKPRNEAGLDQFVASVGNPNSPNYRHYLTSGQYNALYAPVPSDVDQVRAFLKANGMKVTGVSGNQQVIDAVGTAKQAEAAFGTSISDYTGAAGASFYANDNAASVPSGLAGIVSAVTGLSDQQAAHSVAAPSGPSGPGGGYTPAQLRTAYSMKTISGSYNGAGQTIGLIEFDGFKQSDLNAWTGYYSQPSITPTIVPIDGGVTSPGSGQLEVTLDVEALAATAPGAAQVLYESPNTDAGWVDEMARIASDNKVTVLSGSWLAGETCESKPQASHDSYTQMAAQGITLLSASGDWGATGCGYNGDNSTVQADFPASDPNFTGVGGTQLLTSDSAGTYKSESCWNQGGSGNTRSGGGYSQVYSRPSWQPGTNQYRSVPDVSLDADYGAGALSVYENGQWEDVGGTSLASPIWAGYIAMVNQKAKAAGKSDVGALNPTIYAVGQSSQYSTDFNDVTSGNNGTYSAGTGYDLCTGWGSPKGDTLAGALINGVAPPAADDFSIAASPTSVSVAPGKSVTTTISTAVVKGSAESVALSASGLPAGVTASFSPASVTAGNSATLTLTASSSAAAGQSSVTVTGQSTDATHTAPVTLTVTGTSSPVTVKNPGFQFGQRGQAVSLQMQASGGSGAYTWSATGLPAGLSINHATGLISGTPTVSGFYNVTVTAAASGGGSGNAAFSWYIG